MGWTLREYKEQDAHERAELEAWLYGEGYSDPQERLLRTMTRY